MAAFQAWVAQLYAHLGYPQIILLMTLESSIFPVPSELVLNVFSVERLKTLSEQARLRLGKLGYRNIHFGYADGGLGWAAHGPYDGIIVTAAAAEVPKSLLEQLERGGRLVIPVGPPAQQSLRVIDRVLANKWQSRDVAGVSFVPLLEGRG